ncbi:MAG TPA: bifunctional GTP diphosphokinase/guanosine-3',5'-bis pyrophosphate 3'-pyrophosphohydrolase [Gammaproteobacteria bacterium]|nr:bifunctional GTP diphosphokinase/guanosine-3',5'-bis pyrophosphate 3'-pyrophosphohydrolase [Gammaproteobacteria bacterium]
MIFKTFRLTGPSFRELKDELSQYLNTDHVTLIEKAFHVAEKAHKGQKRQSGEPYITHPLAAATILAQLRLDPETIMAALLHDVLEDTGMDKKQLAQEFGEEVANLVDGVSKLAQIEFETRVEAQAENFRKMILAMVKDIRVILVKLADRLHNMRTLGSLEPVKRRRIAQETLEIYAPIANRLGMHVFRLDLEELGFAALYPRRYRVIKDAVKKAGGNRKQILTTIESSLQAAIEKNNLPPAAVIGREKHLYSIYKKMLSKHLSFNEIMDVYGFRIVTDSIDSCYRVLGAVHGLYKPVPERFKDYIAIPKANGYQSLHTILFGPFGVPVEIQIRTVDMDNIAEQGIAAHWLYKEEKGHVSNAAQVRARQWLKSLLEMQQSTGNSLEFIENVKIDLFPDEVYLFTPKGRILELPVGATPVDFAYAIHSDVGNTCIAAKINRRLAPLSTKLSNGQTVEVITAPDARPNPSWLNFVVTGKARSNIRHFLKSQKRAESISFGQQLLESLLASHQLNFNTLPAELTAALLDFYQVKSIDDFSEAIGLGNILPLAAVRYITQYLKSTEFEASSAVAIRGTEGVAVMFAPCCRPIPGDPILGIIQPNHGLMIHVDDCRKITKERYLADKCITVQWHTDVQGQFPVDIVIDTLNQRGLLARMTTLISSMEVDINNVHLTETDDGEYCRIKMTLSVHNRIHLAQIFRRLRNMPSVTHIARKKV